ncbi:helix-turn-helix domain-containing protein [Peribacillus muralis]|uniref:helix-turn-helix domain-containing protein n=1 Tax=Peribacillus muralis TaxID=264697 RepID=UPI003D0067F9
MFQITLTAARVNAGFKQELAAKEIGITAKTLSNYERGITAISGTALKKASKVYGVPSDRIRLPQVDDGVYDDAFFSSRSTL